MRKTRVPRYDLVATHRMPKLREFESGPIREPSFKTDVFAVAMVLSFFSGITVGAFSQDIYMGIGTGSLVGAVVTMLRTWRVYDPMLINPFVRENEWQPTYPVEDEDEVEAIVGDATVVQIKTRTGRIVEFNQPRAGEFANWINQVLADEEDPDLSFNRQTTLSQNTAIDRGWQKGMYRRMIDKLRNTGFLEAGRNGVPEPTAEGRTAFRQWLNFEGGNRVRHN